MTRIAIIGAGLAGLAAADALTKADIAAVVFEARSRPGGRVWSDVVPVDGRRVTIERGAEFVLDGYSAMRGLLAEHGLSLVDTGMSYYVRVPGDSPTVSTNDIVEAGRAAVGLIAELGGAPSAEHVISQLQVRPEVVDALRARIEISTAVSAKSATADALVQVASFEPKPSWRVAGGNQRLPNAIAASLPIPVRYDTFVRAVHNLPDGGVEVVTDHDSQEFDAAVVAVPLAIARDVDTITLPSSAIRRANLERVIQGHAAKLHLTLTDEPEASAVMAVNERYWTWTAVDASGSVAPVMNAFMGSREAIDRARVVADPDGWAQRVRAIRPDLSIDTAATVTTTIWSEDPLARGAYTAHAPRPAGAAPIDLESPIGDTFWAGEYADADFTGLMEGAIRSGQRAAERVVTRFGAYTTDAEAVIV